MTARRSPLVAMIPDYPRRPSPPRCDVHRAGHALLYSGRKNERTTLSCDASVVRIRKGGPPARIVHVPARSCNLHGGTRRGRASGERSLAPSPSVAMDLRIIKRSRHGACVPSRTDIGSDRRDDQDVADQAADRPRAPAGHHGRPGAVGDRHVLPPRRQHRRDPPRELPERPGRRGDEGGAGADGLGRCCSPSAARRTRRATQFARVPADLREEPRDRAGQHHPARASRQTGRRADGLYDPLRRAEPTASSPCRRRRRERTRALLQPSSCRRSTRSSGEADEVLELNQRNMEDEDARARAGRRRRRSG